MVAHPSAKKTGAMRRSHQTKRLIYAAFATTAGTMPNCRNMPKAS